MPYINPLFFVLSLWQKKRQTPHCRGPAAATPRARFRSTRSSRKAPPNPQGWGQEESNAGAAQGDTEIILGKFLGWMMRFFFSLSNSFRFSKVVVVVMGKKVSMCVVVFLARSLAGSFFKRCSGCFPQQQRCRWSPPEGSRSRRARS